MDAISELLVTLTTLLVSLCWDWVKIRVDFDAISKKILMIVKPVQPLLVPSIGLMLAWAANAGFSIVPGDESLIADAPLAGLLIVTLREIVIRLKAARDKKNGLPKTFKP